LAALHRHRFNRPAIDLGDEDPLYTRNLSKGPPDRRRVSLRWLFGSVLTGILSAALVGGALQAAIGLDEYVIVRPASANTTAFGDARTIADKSDRFRPVPETMVTRRVISISTVKRVDGRDVVRVRPYAHVHTNLAAPLPAEVALQVPDFRPADVFSEGEEAAPAMDLAASDSIYGAEVDGEVVINVLDFPLTGAAYDETELATAEVERQLRADAPRLSDGAGETVSLPYIDPARFEMASGDPNAFTALAVAIGSENVTLLEKTDDEIAEGTIEEKVLPVVEGASMRKMLVNEGASEKEATAIQSAFVANFSFDFRAGQRLRIGLAPDPDTGAIRPVRVSLYTAGGRHVATVALSDLGDYVAAEEPATDAELVLAEVEVSPPGVLPTLHEGLWGSGLSLEMPQEVIRGLVHIFSFDVDYQARLSATDDLEVIYAADDADESVEILYAALTLSGVSHHFYRFRDPRTGEVDYYDEAGKSAQRFLMRKPVGQGRFTSGFGMRRHPILRRQRMHSGVDWAAPTGTQIMAAGDGIVEQIGRRAGYGRSITLKHLNGYETTYNHMSGYAKGLKAGDSVSQGQVIGYVGSTGLSTGPHLHFEVLVNNRFVDPMKIRLPRGNELQGAALVAFEQERERIDALLVRDDEGRYATN
jgi:murein DD-endopeptidase MepM/ murein hydrolase activator NlpD